MSGFSPDSVPSWQESEARADSPGINWRTVRTVVYTVVLPIAGIVLLLALAVSRLGGEQ